MGSPHLSFAKEGIKEYKKRISRFADVSVIHIKENKDTEKKIISQIGTNFCVLLDEKGREYDSRGLADFLDTHKNQSRDIVVVIGGPDGHTEAIRNRSDHDWSLSPLTFPHDIAMMITLETLYRSLTILSGHPYHRD